jgi:hypothetical protein
MMGVVLEFPDRRYCRSCARAIGSRRLRAVPRARFCVDCEKAVRRALPNGTKLTEMSMDDIAAIMGYRRDDPTKTGARLSRDQGKTPKR